jgi:glyoxylase-like metal-dependent hydrolase (beta-lactamase superfamily II)
MHINITKLIVPLLLLPVLFVRCSKSEQISESVSFVPGSVNGVIVERSGNKLIINSATGNKIRKADMLLFTHFRRDVIAAGEELVKHGSYTVAPQAEKPYFEKCDSMWASYFQARFHDYYCQTTKFGFSPLKADSYVTGGDTIKWHDIDFRVVNTPGYTRGAVSYLADIDGKRFAFVGDLICGEGKIPDLYSFQDSFRGIRGYHGYASRLGKLISSLQLIAEEKPDLIVPSRGPVIKDPQAAIAKLIQTIRKFYSNYMSISAYRWYYPEQMDVLEDSIPGSSEKVDRMPYASVILKVPPSWYMHISNTNLVFADDSSAFLIDCGTKDAFDELLRLKHSGRLKRIDGIFITHYHDDHTDLINDVRSEFGCPVYVTKELKDILENPQAYHLPCLTTDPLTDLIIMANGETMPWKDFKLTFNYFPGQTLYHDAVLFEKSNGEAIFFSGDSFTPSGIDDYCLLNRNFLHPGTGYFYCLDMLDNLPGNVLISNQHVEPLFAFSRDQIDHMRKVLYERTQIMKELLPFDDISYGIDEQWARIYPYGQKSTAGGSLEYTVKVFNHSSVAKTFTLVPEEREGFKVKPGKASVFIGPLSEGEQTFKVSTIKELSPGVYPLFVSVKFDGWDLNEWCESMVEVTHSKPF